VIRRMTSVVLIALTGCQTQTVIDRDAASQPVSDNTIPIQQTLSIKTTVPPFWPPHKFTPVVSNRDFMNIVNERTRIVGEGNRDGENLIQ